MVKTSLILLLLALPLLMCAQEAPELIELQLDDLGTAAWDSLYKELSAPQTEARLDNRLYLEKDAIRSLHTLLAKRGGQSLLLNYERDWQHKRDHVNLQAQITSKQLVRQAVFGHYRLRFGRGLGIGNGRRGFPAQTLSLDKPSGPKTVNPFGAAARLQWKRLTFLGFGSIRDRQAFVNNSGITSLPASYTEADTDVLETVYGAALAYDTKSLRMGTLWYRQIYDGDFADPDMDTDLGIRSLYGAISLPGHSIDAELVFAGHASQQHLAWQYRHAGFVQSLSFTANPDLRNISYSTSASVLSRDPHTNEVSWDATFPLRKDLSLALRYALNYHERHSFSFAEARSRLAAALDYRSDTSSARLAVFNFNREVLQSIDGSYSVTLPRNWRTELSFRQQVFPGLIYDFRFRYHVEDKNDFDRNSFFFASGFTYRIQDLALGIGYKSWKNFRQYIYYEDPTLEAYNSAQRDDSVLDISAALDVWKLILGLDYRVSVAGDTPQRVILRLGTAL